MADTKKASIINWHKFAKSIGAKVSKIEGGAACLAWNDKNSCVDDDAWFSVNMADKISRAIQKGKP